MNTRLPKKRGGEKTDEIPSKKMVPEKLEAPDSNNYDVIIVVKGQKFQCLKAELSQHSRYLQRMFDSNFQEKNKKEVELRGMVGSDTFDMFLKVVHGEGVVTETYHSEKLMIQVCATIKDAYELDEFIPKDLDSFCNTTKNIVMQRSFELLGIRKPPSPTLPEQPDQVFEHLLNQIIDQVEVQNHHGDVLKDQVELLFDHMIIDAYFCKADKTAEGIISNDPLIKELLDQQRDAHDQSERNFLQLQVLKLKHFYTRLRNPEFVLDEASRAKLVSAITERLRYLSAILNKDEKSQFRSDKFLLGNREIDEMYRRINAEEMQQSHAEQPRNVNISAKWLQGISDQHRRMTSILGLIQNRLQRPRPDNQRKVSSRASFWIIDDLVHHARDIYYTVPQTRRE